MIENPQEKKNKQIALVTTVGVHVLLFLLFLFVIAWRAPDPPLPEYGIELNFGMDEVGTGSTQPDEPAGSQQPSDDEVEESNTDQQESQEQVQEETTQEESTPVQEQAVTPQESTVAVKEEKKPETKPVEKPKEQEKKEVVKTETKPVETTQKTQTQTTAEKTTTDNKEGKPVSHGDDANKTGDKGDPKGLDKDALFEGQKGGGNKGPLLNMAGWEWLETPVAPKPTEQDIFSGKVVFDIEIDSDGYVTKITKREGTVSPELEKRCREAIARSSVQKVSPGKAAEKTTGQVTFNLSIR